MNGLALLILSTAVGMATCNEFKPMKPIARELKPSSASPRIINGARAPINRYQYSVSLQFFGEHFCGASLIAPDLVLSAAHCKRKAGMVKINPHSLSRPIPVSEQFNVVEEYVHPFHGSPSSESNDMMIVKFNGNSSLAPVRINDDNAQPKLNERLVVMGWGITSTSGLVTSPDILHHVNVSYIDNEQCVAISQGAYDGEITDDMLCAQGPKKDSCQGDSGGPLVIPGDIGAEDVQVGVVSWGFGCAEAPYPGVYARTSEEWAWIRFIVCGNSGDPPEYFRCDEGGTTFSPAPTATPTAPTVSAAPSGDVVDVLVAITLDFYPDETGFKIRDTNGNILFEILAGEYQPTNSGETVTHRISLNQQADYVFLLTDSFGDGFEGEAFVYLGTSEDPGSVLAYYSPSISLFSVEYEIPFVVGQDFILNLFPTEAPRLPSPQPSAEPSAPSFSPAPSGTDVTVLLVISLDSWAEETGFRVESETGDVIREVIPGTFSESQSFQVIRDEFQVPSDGTFNLVLLDTFGDGLRTPVYLYLGSEAADQILAHYDPVVSLFDFFISIPFQATTDGIIQIFPTAAPTGPTSVPSGSPSAPSVSSAPSTIDTDVFVQIETGVFGEDMSWSIHSTDGELLHSVPAGTYLSYSQYDERVILAENREFVFTIYDEYGDGFRGNVTLYLGSEPAVDKVIYRFDENLAGPFFTYSAFFTTSENATIDVFPSMAPVSPTLTPSGTPSSPTVSLAPSAPSLLNSQVTVVMVFDAFPFETGYRIENSLGAVVHEVLADNATVSVGITDTFTLPPGDYVFVITDDFGDGFDGQAVVYLGETPLEDNVLAYHGAESFPFSYEQGYDFTPSSEGILDIIIPPPIFFSASGDFEVTLVVDIDPSEPSPMDIAWQLVRIDVPNIWNTAPAILGGLTEPYLESRRYEHRFLAKAGALFVLYIISFGEGNFRGGYEIYFGNNTLPVVKGSGASLGGGGTVHKFVTVEPENTTSLSQTLTAEISFHNNPIGFDWFIQKKELDESSQVIGFGPSGFLDVGGYAEDLAFTTIEAEVTLPMIPPGQTQTFELMQRNTNGTGTFRIWLGPIESGILVLDAAMPTMIEAFSSTTFVIESTATTTPSISMIPSASPKPSTRPSLSAFPTSTQAPSSSPSTSMPSSQFQAPLGILFNFPDSVGWTLRTEQRILASKDSFVSSKRSAEVSLDSLESPQRLEFYIFSGAVDPLDPDSPLSGSYKITSGNTTLAEGDQELGTARTHFFYVGNSGTFPVTMFLKASALKNDFVSWQLSRVNFFGPDELLNNSLMFADPGASIAATSMVTEGQLHGLEINADSQDIESQHIAVGSADAFGGRRLVPTERNNFFVAREIFEQPVAANSNNTLRLEISFGNDPSQIGWALYMNNESSTPVSASRQGDSALQGLTLYTFGPGAEYTTSTSTTTQEEEISLPDIGVNRFREFTFVIYNRSGQGLRPNGEYKVYDGARLIALGSIASGFGDRHIFSRAGPIVPTASPSMAPSSEATTLIPTLSNAEEEAKTGPPVALGNDTGTGPATTSGSLPNVSTATVVTFAFVVSLMF